MTGGNPNSETQSPADAAAFVLKVLQDLHRKICGETPLNLESLRNLRDDVLDDPAFIHVVKRAATANDTYDLRKEGRKLATCLDRREAEWKAESDLIKEVGVVGGAAFVVASIGAMAVGPFAVIAMIGAGLFAGGRGYFAVKRLERERHEYQKMSNAAEKVVEVLDHV